MITPRRITLRLARIVLAQETVCSDKSGGRWEFVGNYHDAESRDTEVKVCGGVMAERLTTEMEAEDSRQRKKRLKRATTELKATTVDTGAVDKGLPHVDPFFFKSKFWAFLNIILLSLSRFIGETRGWARVSVPLLVSGDSATGARPCGAARPLKGHPLTV